MSPARCLVATVALLAGCGHAGHGSTSHAPPRPPVNAAGDTLVAASGAQQGGPAGLVENAAIVGEPVAAGTTASAGAVQARHGFTPPRPPGWPSGIARR